jgi:hypothetical protein
LKKLIEEEMKKIVLKVTKEDGYQPEEPLKMIIADRSLKFRVSQHFQFKIKVLSKAMKEFKNEIPSYDIAPINTGKEAVEWFFKKITSQKPVTPLQVPENVRTCLNFLL